MKKFTVQLGPSKYGVTRYNGEVFASAPLDHPIAFDTETEVIEGHGIPRLALWTASAGSRTVVGHPDDLATFFERHASAHFVAYNTAFDFWVCDTHFLATHATRARDVLWLKMDSNHFHDAMVLDQLLRLAEGRVEYSGPDDDKSSVYPRNLGVVAYEYSGLELDKTDPYRKRFGELIGRDWNDPSIEPGFWSYAAKDTIATYFTWPKIVTRARNILKRARTLYPRFIDDKAEERFGLLTESLQTKAMVALAAISRRGFAIDKVAAREQEAALRATLDSHVLTMHTFAPDVFKYTSDPRKPDAQGQLYFEGFAPSREVTDLVTEGKTRTPAYRADKLKEHLASIAQRLGVRVPRSTGKKADISHSSKAWAAYSDHDPFLKAWCEATKAQTALRFFHLFHRPESSVHPRYNALLLTGRTSASGANLQQCCSGDTEVLTDSGWRKFADITEDDPPRYVAAFDPESRSIAFVEPEAWIDQEWSDVVLHFSNSNIDFCVTPDHRCILEDREGNLREMEAQDISGDLAVVHGGTYPGGDLELGPDLLRFLIAFQADGTWDQQQRLAFHIKRDDKLASLFECMESLGVEYDAKKNANSGSTHIIVDSDDLVAITAKLLGEDKLFGPWLLGLSRDDIDFFVDEIWLWDGDSDRLTGYTSEHEANASWVATMCALSGRRAQFRQYENNGGRIAYVVDHSAEDVSSYITHAEVTETEAENGHVYCVTVPTGFIVTRRDGKVTITGNCPRESSFRELFVARPGHKLLTVDYSFIELRTLAATCEARNGHSRLGDVIREGVDPHEHTAALVLEKDIDEFRALKTSHPKEYKQHRQKAKAANFGLPAGLGPAKLSWYAKTSYGVEMSVDEAFDLREFLSKEVYPEIGEYLEDDSIRAIQWTLGVTPEKVARAFHLDDLDDKEDVGRMMRAVAKVLRGKPFKANGAPYKAGFVERIWLGLAHLVDASKKVSPSDKRRVKEKKPSPALERKLLGGPAMTLTGRIRGSCSYTQARNTPFQGLAADGMKLALWELLKRGLHVVNMVHDEVVVELPETDAERLVPVVEKVLCDSMEQVIGNRLPIAVESNLGPCWAKD